MVTDFMGSYIDKSGMDFYFASSHHVDKTPESYESLRQDLSQYTAITGMQEVYPIEYLLDVPEEKITEGYDEIWKQFYPVDRPFMSIPAYNALGDNLKTVEIIPVNQENFQELTFTGTAPTYQELLSSGQVIFCQSEVFRLNGMMQITQFGTFEAGDTIRVAQLVNDEMMQIRELTIGAVLESTPWFAPEKSHGFILVPIETIDNYFEQGTPPTNLYTTAMMSIRVDPEQLPAMQDTLYERSVAAFGTLIGYLILYAAIEVLKNYLFISLFNPAVILLATFAVTLVLTMIAGSLPIGRVRKSSIVESLRAIT